MTRVMACAAAAILAACAQHKHWSYEGETGPEYWADLSPRYELARTGTRQSPIDIRSRALVQQVAAPADEITFHYRPTPLTVTNNGHTVQVDYAEGSYMMLGGERYDLKQFHFHSPSEHTVNGRNFALEGHLVHENADGKLAVVAVFVDVGGRNRFLKPIWANIPAEGSREVEGVEVNANDFLPSVHTAYRYSGSLTTPPCTEGVEWVVMRLPVQASPEQVEAFRQLYFGNNRPTQFLNERRVRLVAQDRRTY